MIQTSEKGRAKENYYLGKKKMCRGFQQNERERLKIKAFSTRLSASCSKNKPHLPDFLTLHYLPRINGSLMEINGSNLRPDSPAFVTLHRVLSSESSRGAVYASKERVAVCEGVKFEIYVGDVKVLKGIFRKDEGEKWKIDCKLDDFVEGWMTLRCSSRRRVRRRLCARRWRWWRICGGGRGGGVSVVS
ncbi:UNVERIFIED_CONTAM: hypothetical protein Slati_1987100 [Sesamum latifolium]|uniref:Uncharacterized protein n=1 Tax=Sesamum latifolium TaxID=2727402 RepID=A0AAW2WL99_9LAMI